MSADHPVYRALVRLYPRDFRREYGDDLVAHHAEFMAERGAPAAWARTALDLAVTLPTFHLERAMSQSRSATALVAVIGLLAAAGLVSIGTGDGPGLLLLAAAIVLAVVQRSTLARSLRIPNTKLRRRRLLTSAVLAAVFVATYTAFLALIGDHWSVRETVLAAIGTPAMFGAIGFLAAGLLTPRSADHGRPAPATS